MKRASLLFATLLTTSVVQADETSAQRCAEEAFNITGESRYELKRSRQVSYGQDWYEVTLNALESGQQLTCKVRRGKVTAMNVGISTDKQIAMR